jgi:hypothetical protein
LRRRLTVLVLAGAALVAAQSATAAIEGPCEASIAAVDVRDRGTSPRSAAIPVHETTRPLVRMSSERPLTHLKVEMQVTGFIWTVHDEPTDGREVEAELPVDDYATWGIGLFEVTATGTGSGFTCTATALIDVEGSAIATAAGLAGLGLTVVGAAGVLVLIMRGGRAGGQPFAGVFFGAALGIGIGTLLQQFGVIYPTILVTIVVIAAGAAIGFLAGMIGFRQLE